MNGPFPRLSRELRALVRSGELCVGAQLYARAHASSLSLALGTAFPGKEMRADTVSNVYCLTKPVLAMYVAGLIDRGVFGWATPVADVLPTLDWPQALTIETVLNHTAGLHSPTA